jgi:uncharacterized protein
MTFLLDANVLVALHNESHTDFERAHSWFRELKKNKFATCAKTQGGFLRAHLVYFADEGVPAAFEKLEQLCSAPHHVFWGDDLSYVNVSTNSLQGRKQLTDAWLAQLCRIKKGKLVTFDKGLMAQHSDVSVLL